MHWPSLSRELYFAQRLTVRGRELVGCLVVGVNVLGRGAPGREPLLLGVVNLPLLGASGQLLGDLGRGAGNLATRAILFLVALRRRVVPLLVLVTGLHRAVE